MDHFKGGRPDKKAQTWTGKTQQVGLIKADLHFFLQKFDNHVNTIFLSYFSVEIEVSAMVDILMTENCTHGGGLM